MSLVPNPTRVVHCKKEDYDIYIGRGGRWGNPFTHLSGPTKATYRVATREEAIQQYERWLVKAITDGGVTLDQLAELYGKTLGCYCAPKPCHGEVLAHYADMAARITNRRS